ncbi:hypothetical protein B0H17DRAFT_947419 [Mycena rosella]|uniref:Uncharacterized protein n=1 Tax=Mycena rosella TaxID=1033263 RepID=A0AAD7D0F4_MYCRO|nr:hypothetical protein B0H17DRAFT_947419 [Mycena rosella]
MTRASAPAKPAQLSLSGSTYQDFDPQRLYSYSTPDLKREPYTPNSAASETDFLNTPLSALFPGGLPKPPRQHPFARGFEAPEWRILIVHVALCALAYLILLVFVLIADRRTLFWSRLVVGMGCGAMGVALGISLTRLAQRFLESATWATLIHQSRVSENPGIRLRDLASGSDYPTNIIAAVRLLWNRTFYHGTARRARKNYDSRPWSLVVVFFLIIVIISASLSFILGRVVDISAFTQHQLENYFEVAIFADLSDADIERAAALEPAFNDFTLTWTLSPFSSHGALPDPVSFPWQNDTIYFAATTRSQLLPDGQGFGTFEVNSTAASIQTDPAQQAANDGGKPAGSGVILRSWGIRIHCAKFTDPNTMYVAHKARYPVFTLASLPRSASDLTYVFTPRDMLRSLFSSFGMDFPSLLEESFKTTTVMQANDTLPIGLNANDLALTAVFTDNGVAHSFKSVPISLGEDGKGFVSIETLLVRLNTTYTPNGAFLTHSDLPVFDVNGRNTFIGLDAAVCLELYEPWIVETYNNSIGVPTTIRIVDKGNTIVDANATHFVEKNIRPPLTDPTIKRQLDSTKLLPVYDVAHGNSANQILKDNGRDAFYVPSPTLVSFLVSLFRLDADLLLTGVFTGRGPQGYLELSGSYFAQARAMADASNALSYLAGSGQTVARCYTDNTLSSTQLNVLDAAIVIATVLVLGLVAGFFVPRLPMSVPRRGFELYSWMAAFYSNELVLDRIDQSEAMVKQLELQDIQKHMGDVKLRYGF